MTPTNASSFHKVVIIRAGFHGIVAAKTYLEIYPHVDIQIIDQESSIGGVWAASRIYPGFDYDLPAPLLNFTEFDMCEELGIEKWPHVSGEQVNDFLVRSPDLEWTHADVERYAMRRSSISSAIAS